MRDDQIRFQVEQLNQYRKRKRARQCHGSAAHEPGARFRFEHVDGKGLYTLQRRRASFSFRLLELFNTHLDVLGFSFKVFEESIPLFTVACPSGPFKLRLVDLVAPSV